MPWLTHSHGAYHHTAPSLFRPAGKLTDIVRLLATYGGLYDRQLAERAAGLWGIDLSDIRAGKPRSPQVLPITIQVRRSVWWGV